MLAAERERKRRRYLVSTIAVLRRSSQFVFIQANRRDSVKVNHLFLQDAETSLIFKVHTKTACIVIRKEKVEKS